MSEEKKNAVTEEVKEARELTEEELENVNGGGSIGAGGTTFPQTVAIMTGARVVMAGVNGPAIR